jgi:hypothetical protein
MVVELILKDTRIIERRQTSFFENTPGTTLTFLIFHNEGGIQQ